MRDPLLMAFGGSSAPPPPPAPAPIPDREDPAFLAAARRPRESQTQSGRLSTLLTGDDLYSGDKLGLR
jgi:hypothetical protein